MSLVASSFIILPYQSVRETWGRPVAINSTLGYEGADIILRTVASRTEEYVSQWGFVSRLGASVFAIVWPMMSDPYQARARFLNLRSRLRKPIEIEGAHFEPQITAGIALYPQHGNTYDQLYRNATNARHLARRVRDGFAVYEPQQMMIPFSNLGILAELRHALSRHQFYLLYQPKIDLSTDRIIGAEALIRWQHPEQGFIPPDHFIPLAEESGLITPITDWVIDAATNECARWREEGYPIGVSVNVSTKDILEEGFMYGIRQAIKAKPITTESLTLEITESAVMDDPKSSLESLSSLRASGLKLAMDDYGTGYSSMAYLSKLPIQELKIDKSIVLNLLEDLSTTRIVSSTIALGHELGLEVTAEGVENENIKMKLLEMGCDIGQGYGISKPLTDDQFLEFCDKYGKY